MFTNFIWDAFDRSYLGRRHRGPSGFTGINCPMCVSRGESADKRHRCGVKATGLSLGVNCFNCGFKAGWKPGYAISNDLKSFLSAVGVGATEIAAICTKAAIVRKHHGGGSVATIMPPSNFPATALPPGARSLEEWAATNCVDPDFVDVASYLFTRGEEIASRHTYFWSPDPQDGMSRRLIIPFTYGGNIVGYTGRAIDAHVEPRYHSRKPADFLFNHEVMRLKKRKYLLIVEGVFDAIALNSVGALGSTISPRQAAWIRESGQTVIVLPDQDEAGKKMIDAALRYGWSVAFPRIKGEKPWWDDDVTDAADAVARYGQGWTTLSVIESATSDPGLIRLRRSLM